MKHPRQIIRDAVAAQFKFKTAAQDRVFKGRDAPWRRNELPGIALYTPEEDSELETFDGGLKREITLEVVGIVSMTADMVEDVENAVDSLAAEIEAAWLADRTFGGNAWGSVLTHTTTTLADDQGRPVAGTKLTFTVRYRTAAE